MIHRKQTSIPIRHKEHYPPFVFVFPVPLRDIKNPLRSKLTVTMIALLFIVGCNYGSSSNKPENKIVIPETENQQQSIEITTETALNAFHAYLKETKETHKLCTDCPGGATKAVIGDLNKDGQSDAIVQYTFEPNEDDLQFGQSAIYSCVGFVVLENRNNTLIPIQNVLTADVLTFSTTENVTIKEINQQGEIILEKVIDTDFESEVPNEENEKYITKQYKTHLSKGKIIPIDI